MCLPVSFCPNMELHKTYTNLLENNSVIRAIHLHDSVFLLAYAYGCIVEVRDLDAPADQELPEENRFRMFDEL